MWALHVNPKFKHIYHIYISHEDTSRSNPVSYISCHFSLVPFGLQQCFSCFLILALDTFEDTGRPFGGIWLGLRFVWYFFMIRFTLSTTACVPSQHPTQGHMTVITPCTFSLGNVFHYQVTPFPLSSTVPCSKVCTLRLSNHPTPHPVFTSNEVSE